MIAFGFAFGPTAYLKSGWNRLDLLIVLTSALVIAAETVPQLQPLKGFRVLRVLRPLRLISRSPGMKMIVDSLVRALPDVSNVFLVVLALQATFAILGMQLWMGTFGECTQPSLLTREECERAAGRWGTGEVGHYRALEPTGERIRWTTPGFGSFDSFGDAMKLLYIMGTGDEWEAPMYSMMAATSPGAAPVRNDYSPALIFGISWMFLGAFFAIELFVGKPDLSSRMRAVSRLFSCPAVPFNTYLHGSLPSSASSHPLEQA